MNHKFALRKYWLDVSIILLLGLATILINWKMLRDGLNGMTDLQWHITWFQHFSKQLAEGIVYPRWLAGTNYGYGSPTFVFYPPLAFYLASLGKQLGLNAEYSIIAVFSLSLFLCGFNFYLYGRDRWGKVATAIGALAYMSAPYFAFDIYWRGGFASMLAQAWLPLGLYCTEKSLSNPKWGWGVSLCFVLLSLTHLPSFLLFSIVWFAYLLFCLLRYSWKSCLAVLAYAVLGLGVAAFFLLPALVEQSWVSIEIVKGAGGGFEFNTFGTLHKRLAISSSTVPLIHYSFAHQACLAILSAFLALFATRRNTARRSEALAWIALLICLAFLMSSWSLPLWRTSEILQKIQFPWRLMQIFVFASSALLALVVSLCLRLPSRHFFWKIAAIVIVCVLPINFKYFQNLSRSIPTINNPGRGKPIENVERIKTALNDPFKNTLIDVKEYRPLVEGKLPPKPILKQPPVSAIAGKATVEIAQWKSYSRRFNVKAIAPTTLLLRTYAYPAWDLSVNQIPTPITTAADGRIKLELKPGTYLVDLEYRWTNAFKVGIILSLGSLVALIIVSFHQLCQPHPNPSIGI